jgi:pimeloyl-ACP methyl ester carboxylesterase
VNVTAINKISKSFLYISALSITLDFPIDFIKFRFTPSTTKKNAPTLVIQGYEDQYGTEKQLKLIQQAVPTAQLKMMKGVKHHPHLEKTDEVVEMICGFLVEK